MGEPTETSFTVVVIDVNDELPVFNRDAFTVPVPEDVGKMKYIKFRSYNFCLGAGIDTPLPGLTLEVMDKDIANNAEFSLFLEPVSENSRDVFYVYPEKAIGKSPVIIR